MEKQLIEESPDGVATLTFNDELVALLKPSPDASLKIWPVGNVRNNGPHLALPV